MVVKLDKVPFEDALSMTGFGKFNIVAFMLCSSIIMGMAFEIFSVSYLVPGSICELNTTSTQQGMMAGVPLIGIIVTSHFWGYLADTRGRRKILTISMSMAFITGSLAALSPNWIVLSILKFGSSAAVSGAFALSLTLLSENIPVEKRSTMVLLTTSVFLFSTGLMAVISIPILPLKFSYYIPVLDIHFNSWRLLDLIFAVPSAIGAIGIYFWYESPKYLLGAGREKEALEVLKGVFAMNSGKDKEMYRVNSIYLDEEKMTHAVGFWASVKAQTLPMMKAPLLLDTLLLSVLMFLVYICINPFVVWLPFIVDAAMTSLERGDSDLTLCQMIRSTRNYTSTELQAEDCSMDRFAMLMVFGINVLIAVLNLVTSGLSSCVGRKAVFIAIQLMGGVAAIFINFSSVWILIAFLLMVYLMGIINFGTLAAFCVDVFPTHVKAMAVCLTVMVGRGSAVLGINLLKRLLDDSCEAAFYIFGSLTLVSVMIGLLLPTDKKLLQRKEDFKNKMAADC